MNHFKYPGTAGFPALCHRVLRCHNTFLCKCYTPAWTAVFSQGVHAVEALWIPNCSHTVDFSTLQNNSAWIRSITRWDLTNFHQTKQHYIVQIKHCLKKLDNLSCTSAAERERERASSSRERPVLATGTKVWAACSPGLTAVSF